MEGMAVTYWVMMMVDLIVMISFDKGYRLILECLAHGKTCWQPMFGRSNHRYNNVVVLLTTLVASTISGNERSVKKA